MTKTAKPKSRGKKPRRVRRGRADGFALKFLKWSGVVAVWAFFVALCLVAWLAYDLPSLDRLTNATRRPSITLVTADGQILASYGDLYGKPVRLNELPPYLTDALLAKEDRRFYRHIGIDPIGLLRAILADISAGHLVQGGSTITQQLAKNIFLTPARTIRRKGQELLLALWLEHNMTKEQILTLYLNRVYFGSGAYGVEAAARKYFGKPAAKVTPFEAAMLVGMVKAPSRYNPISDPHEAVIQASLVLRSMADAGYMTARDAERAANQGAANLKPPPAASGQYYSDWVLDQVSDYVNYTDRDLVVVTTIDRQAQALAETTVDKTLDSADAAKNANQGALVAMTPDGAVRALVGGRDYGTSQFNRASQAQRQPGSAFKLFVYLAAMEAGLTPLDTMVDQPVSVGAWRPSNFDDHYYGSVNLRDAFARSLNSVAVQLAQRVGLNRVVDAARRLGITAPLSAKDASIALGSSSVSLVEMTAAYAAFDNRGFGVWPYGIEQILDADGNVLYKRTGSGPGQVVGARAVDEMLGLMRAVVAPGGTGQAADIGRPAAGKTGTSSEFRDAWFIGFTADLVTGVWVGNDDNAPMNKVTGGSLPTHIWHDFMAAAESGLPVKELPSPGGELPAIAYDTGPISATPAAAEATITTQPPLGDNTPSPQIQSIIERLRQQVGDHGRK